MSNFQPRSGASIYASDGRPLTLNQELGKGGEGSVWTLSGEPSLVAKFYHKGLGPDQSRKIEAMCRLKSDGLLRIAAWPVATLKSSAAGSVEGFMMPRINGCREAHLLYTPKSRRVSFPEAQFPFIVHASINIARAFATVHDSGQVIGDVNHGNLLISNSATVSLIDCDSFEIKDGNSVYPCQVGVPTYTPPELQGKSFQGVRRTKQHDEFGLAVLIFHMLFLGRHPFAGIFRHGTADKTIEDAIREFRFAYLPDNRMTEMESPPSMPGLSAFPPDIGQLFVRAFSREGATGNRPAASEWVAPLEHLSGRLTKCKANDTHDYFNALTACPWCRVENAFGRPMFGFKLTLISGADFDLLAVWAQIEAVRPDETGSSAPSPSSFTDRCEPDVRVIAIKEQRRIKRGYSIGSILIAVVMVVPGDIPSLPSIFILFIGLVAMTKFWRSGESYANGLKNEDWEAKGKFNTGASQLEKLRIPPAAFQEKKQRLAAEKLELAELPAVKARRMAELTANLRQKQLTSFLERHLIEDASIPGIGPGRKALLRCYNVEDASDVSRERLDIKGFGPALRAAVLAWRYVIEQRFVFNPNQGIDPADVRAIEQDIAKKRAALIQSLSTGSQQLRQVLIPWQVERSRLAANLNDWAKEVAQAEVNIRALGRF
jgi:DNA-binding helix-hairpin-helix protein with protein kinase domain